MQVEGLNRTVPGYQDWHRFLSRATLALGVLLLGSAVVCLVAANWPLLGKAARLGGLQALLALCMAAAAAALAWRGTGGQGKPRHLAQALTVLGGILLGALLALLGQTYQTGADTWQLFAWWTLLLLPWALATGGSALWLLWVGVCNAAAGLFFGERLPVGGWLGLGLGLAVDASIVLAILNIALLAIWEWVAARRALAGRSGPRVLVFLGLGALLVDILLHDIWSGDTGLDGVRGLALSLWVLLTLVLGGFYSRQGRRDLAILAMLAAGVVMVSLRLLGEVLLRMEPGLWVLLPLAALLIAETVLAVRGLRYLAALPGAAGAGAAGAANVAGVADVTDGVDGAATAGSAQPGAPRAGSPAQDGAAGSQRAAAAAAATPWYVHGLLALSAWLAALLVLPFLYAADLFEGGVTDMWTGLVLAAASVVALKAAVVARGLFLRQLAVALGLAGQLVAAVGLAALVSDGQDWPWLALLALSAAMLWLAPDTLLRFLSALVLASVACALYWFRLGGEAVLYNADAAFASVSAWTPVTVLLAWAAAAAFIAAYRQRWPGSDVWRAAAWAFALSVQALAALALGGQVQWGLARLWQLAPWVQALVLAGAMLPAVVAAVLAAPQRRELGTLAWAMPAGLAVLVLCWLPSPGIVFALLWLLLGFALALPALTGLGVVSLLAYLLLYYFQLDVALLDKALWLAAAGVLLGAMRALLAATSPARGGGTAASPAVPAVPAVPTASTVSSISSVSSASPSTMAAVPAGDRWWRPAALLAGLLLVLAVVNTGIWQYERLLATGRPAVLALAPVDPRSLMQGDYMALRFALAEQIQEQLVQRAPGGDGDDGRNGSDGSDDASNGSDGSDSNDERAAPVYEDGYAVLAPGPDGVAQLLRIQARPEPRATGELALRFRVRDGQVRLVTNAWFFAEGMAEHYAAARYGELRVAEDGQALLLRMLDESLAPL